jgi:peptidase M1-like protein
MRAGLLVVLAACSSAERGRPTPAVPPATTPGSGAVAADPSPPELRLPGDVRPTSYALDLTIVPDQPAAAGRVHIAAEVVRPARIVWLHASGLAIARAELDGKPARRIEHGTDVVGVTLDRPLAPGRLAIDLAFTAPIDRERSRGIYSEREGSERYPDPARSGDARAQAPVHGHPGARAVALLVRRSRDHGVVG